MQHLDRDLPPEPGVPRGEHGRRAAGAEQGPERVAAAKQLLHQSRPAACRDATAYPFAAVSTSDT